MKLFWEKTQKTRISKNGTLDHKSWKETIHPAPERLIFFSKSCDTEGNSFAKLARFRARFALCSFVKRCALMFLNVKNVSQQIGARMLQTTTGIVKFQKTNSFCFCLEEKDRFFRKKVLVFFRKVLVQRCFCISLSKGNFSWKVFFHLQCEAFWLPVRTFLNLETLENRMKKPTKLMKTLSFCKKASFSKREGKKILLLSCYLVRICIVPRKS